MKILVTIDLKEKYLDNIREVDSAIEISKKLDFKEQIKEIEDADIMISGGGSNLDLLQKAGKLDWVQTWSAGVEDYTYDEVVEVLKEKGIRVASMSGIHGDPIAEHVMGFLINYNRKLYEFYDQQKENLWKDQKVTQLSGRTIVIVGTGSIGVEIARRAKSFKMKTIGVKREVNKEVDFIDELYSNQDLHRAISMGDYLVVTVPLTEETKYMFGEEEFKVMKESAFFVNIARGEIVNEKALIEALKNRTIAAAGLDVFEEEPLPVDSPLYGMDNVYITPHISGAHPDYNKNAISIFIENLKRYLNGEELINLVDYNRGY
ncbi:MAG: D-2-hydroxyacid dehydrogenase [Halanaerobiales bacterium]